MQWILIVLVCIVLTTGVSLLFVNRLVQTLRREEQGIQSQGYSSIAGYQRLSRLYTSSTRSVYVTMVVVVVAVIEFAIFNNSVFDILYTGNPFTLFGTMLCIIGIVILIPITVYIVLRALLVDTPALRLFRVSVVTQAQVLQCALRRELPVRILMITLFEVAGILTATGAIGLVWLIAVLALALVVSRIALGKRLYLWCNVATPLTQSAYAGLEPRIREWASRVGVEIGNIYVVSSSQLGAYSASFVGGSHPTLFVNEFFLRQTDWRQHDSLIVHSLILAKRKAYLYPWVLAAIQILFVAVILLLTILAVVANSSLFVFDVILFVVYLIFLSIYQSRIRTLYRSVDQQVVMLTGDPFAMLVTLNSTGVISPRQWGGAVLQMRHLEMLMQQRLPRAPWSNVLVSSAIPLVRNNYTYTLPLSQALPLEPVERQLA